MLLTRGDQIDPPLSHEIPPPLHHLRQPWPLP